jgi:uncharacterized membrane protein (UPF0127 family)
MKPLAVLLLLFGCTKAMPPVPATQTTPPQSVTQTAPAAPAAWTGPRVILPDGFGVKIEIANEEELRADGLMYRDSLASDAGMLFFFPAEGEYPFWMKNTRIPLDMIWIDSNRRIVHVKHDVPPCRTPDCPSYPPNANAKYVLEVAGGVAKQHGLKTGDVLTFEGTENVVAH